MRGMSRPIKNCNYASIGVGALIVFIALVLLAGIAATVLIQTSSILELQTMSTGRETTEEVSTGVTVFSVEGYAETGSDISKIALLIRPRAGSYEIDLSTTYIELSDTNKKVILTYNQSWYSDPGGQSNIFSAAVFPEDRWPYHDPNEKDASEFGIMVMEDGDDSISGPTPIINKGDKVFICINTTATFNTIAERTDVWGRIVPENGGEALIEFTTPATYSDTVMEILLNM